MRAQALVAALLVALLVPAAAAAAESDQLEPAILVEAAGSAPVESVTTLVAGRTYTIAVGGYYFEKIPTTDGGTFTYTYDGVYCFEGSTSTSVCSRDTPRLFDGAGLRVRIGGSGDFGPFYRQLGAFTGVPAFKEGNNYSREFTPTKTGRLQMTIARDLRDTYSGALHVTLYGPPSPGSTGPPDSGPSPDLHDLLNSACNAVPLGGPIFRIPRVDRRAVATASAVTPTGGFCPKRQRGAPRWNRPSATPALAPGDEAILFGPDLSATQRDATITLTTSIGDVAIALTEDDAKLRRYARRACLLVATEPEFRRLIDKDAGSDSILDAGAFVGVAGVARYLLPCLRKIDDALARAGGATKSARSASVRAGAAATGCRALPFPIRVAADKNPSRVRIQSRGRDPLPNVLRITCLKTRDGVTVHIRPLRSGVPLRQLVGKRLSVGLLRPKSSKGTARGTINFRR